VVTGAERGAGIDADVDPPRARVRRQVRSAQPETTDLDRIEPGEA